MQQYVEAYRNNPEVKQKADEAMQQLLTRSATDVDFRKLLLSDSRTALNQHFGREVPEAVNIVFVENKGSATVVLPDMIDPSAELSESELEAVNGGSPAVAVTITLIAAYYYYQEVSQD
ncbi:MAG TPA: hypothetical protein VEX86_22640 [Longimicrobium sp.]|nr:hypothetical protein [Longimicrobium sp.]